MTRPSHSVEWGFNVEVLIGIAIAGVVAFFVVQDATTLKDEEIAVFGASEVSPGLWGTGVFLLAIVFLPAYILTRISHNSRLMAARLDGAPRVSVPAVAPVAVSALDEIEKAHALFERNAITLEEFEMVKARSLRGDGV